MQSAFRYLYTAHCFVFPRGCARARVPCECWLYLVVFDTMTQFHPLLVIQHVTMHCIDLFHNSLAYCSFLYGPCSMATSRVFPSRARGPFRVPLPTRTRASGGITSTASIDLVRHRVCGYQHISKVPTLFSIVRVRYLQSHSIGCHHA